MTQMRLLWVLDKILEENRMRVEVGLVDSIYNNLWGKYPWARHGLRPYIANGARY